ncbi:ankyrin repeat domain-containing protein [archaeon]|nr:MAG: ankyrin repeat domain-containing protein [archaeon]
MPIHLLDSHGNTLLILAAQQGSKRMCKFLLRRGANINMQNLVGNTCLHYCYAYSQRELAEYLKKKVGCMMHGVWCMVFEYMYYFLGHDLTTLF